MQFFVSLSLSPSCYHWSLGFSLGSNHPSLLFGTDVGLVRRIRGGKARKWRGAANMLQRRRL
eukprot:2223565-Rhodomonas_salina.1